MTAQAPSLFGAFFGMPMPQPPRTILPRLSPVPGVSATPTLPATLDDFGL